MQKNVFAFLGRRIELWTHPEPDHLGRVIRASGTFYEPDVLMKCRQMYLPGTAIIDVGANIGNHCIFFGAILDAPVYAFEPFRANHELLTLNIAANDLDAQVITRCCGIGETVGMGALQPGPADNLGATKLTFGGGETTVRSIDSLAIPGVVGMVKVDVEGGELPVLLGAEAMIEKWLPDIVVEAASEPAFRQLASFLLRFGYVPAGRFAATPTYFFSAADQVDRMRRILTA
jgi:protein O-GlcNAc transferase